MKRLTLLALKLFLVVTLVSCGGVSDLPPIENERQFGEYLLGPGDEIRVTVFGQPELTGSYLVSDSGQVAVPLIAGIEASGVTADNLAERIAEELRSAEVVLEPSVSVEVRTYRPFFILGEVAGPGRYPYESDMTVLTAVAIAGGFTDRGRRDLFEITRARDGTTLQGQAGPEVRIQPGDVIRVLERYF
ncbi:polysaccharide biosynthesis/export family protein [Algihabitans albus]|uniref:polysaccharide biosynthesis/export family protein n=1 Tax=Algihabitans albus TaxID=2164067 RepID=UPI000E5D5C31|nr:polysaccharide biosynthesis/export family protein [Algihabitans albus]